MGHSSTRKEPLFSLEQLLPMIAIMGLVAATLLFMEVGLKPLLESQRSSPKSQVRAERAITAMAIPKPLFFEEYPQEIKNLGDNIIYYSEENSLDPDLVASIIYVESWFDPSNPAGYTRYPDGPVTSSCTSTAGALGEIQVMPFNAEGYNLRITEQNIKRGTEKLPEFIDATGSDYADQVAEIPKSSPKKSCINRTSVL